MGDKTTQAVISAVESGALKRGASQLLGSFEPITIGVESNPHEAENFVKVSGAENGMVTIKSETGAIEETNMAYFPQSIYRLEGGQEEEYVGFDSATVTNDENRYRVDFSYIGEREMHIVVIKDDTLDLEGIKVTLNGNEIQNPEDVYEVSPNERELIIEMDEGFKLQVLYYENPFPENKLDYDGNKIPLDSRLWIDTGVLVIVYEKI